MPRWLYLFLIGFGMGTADLVPGVSGGTIAFISGIYEELIESIKKVSGPAFSALCRGKVSQTIAHIPFSFLIPLCVGLFGAVILLSSLLTYLLDAQPILLRSFFFGLVLASILVVRRQIRHWAKLTWLVFIVSLVLAYFVVGLVPVQTPATSLAFFLSGAIAICAMILPGISGSFLLLIMGKYEQVLAAVHDRDLITIGIFLLGAVIGLTLFSRLLSWMFQHYYNIVMVALTGLMLGSLRKLWPWQYEGTNYFPELDMALFWAIVLLCAGAILVLGIDRGSRSHAL